MSKFLKFEDALSLELSMSLLSSLTGEDVDKEIIRRLVKSKYLNPLVGRGRVLVGFTFDELKKIASGEVGLSIVLSEIGVPASDSSVMLNDSIISAAATIKGDIHVYFLKIKPDVEGAEQLKDEYCLDDLLPVDPWDLDEWSLLVREIYQVAEFANEIGTPQFTDVKTIDPKLVIESHEGMPSFVVSIEGLSHSYPTGKLNPAKMVATIMSASEDVRPSHVLVVSALLDLLAEKGRSPRNQSAIISEIVERYPARRGLSKRNLEAIFSAANKAANAAD